MLIRLQTGDGSESREASCSPCGLLAFHKADPHCIVSAWQRSDGWAVTHVGTGLRIGSRRTREGALALRRELERLGDAWNFADPSTVDLTALKASVNLLGIELHGKR